MNIEEIRERSSNLINGFAGVALCVRDREDLLVEVDRLTGELAVLHSVVEKLRDELFDARGFRTDDPEGDFS